MNEYIRYLPIQIKFKNYKYHSDEFNNSNVKPITNIK